MRRAIHEAAYATGRLIGWALDRTLGERERIAAPITCPDELVSASATVRQRGECA